MSSKSIYRSVNHSVLWKVREIRAVCTKSWPFTMLNLGDLTLSNRSNHFHKDSKLGYSLFSSCYTVTWVSGVFLFPKLTKISKVLTHLLIIYCVTYTICICACDCFSGTTNRMHFQVLFFTTYGLQYTLFLRHNPILQALQAYTYPHISVYIEFTNLLF